MISMFTSMATNTLATARAKLGTRGMKPRHRRHPWLVDQTVLEGNKASFGINALQRFKTETVLPFIKDKRSEHLKAISLDEDVLSEEQKAANQHFVFASVGVVVTSTCMLLYPPLILPMLPAFVWLNIPFFQEAYRDLVHKRRVTTVVVDATLHITSLAVTPFSPIFFVYGAMGSWVYALTNKVTTSAKDGTRKQLTNLMGQQPKTVWSVQDGAEVETPFTAIEVNDLIVIDAGQMIPVDGLIQQGLATVDQHMLTGEAQPAEKGAGDPVFAATLVLAGRIVVQVQKTGAETAAAQVGQMLLETAEFTSAVELRGKAIADRAALPTLVLSGAFLPWVGISRALAILFSGIGYNLKIIGPLSVLNYLQRLAVDGILIKDGRALEHISQVDTVVFDKTGTLTLEQPHVGKIHRMGAADEEMLLRFAAAAEQRQSHPIAKAIMLEAGARQLVLPAISAAAYEVGYGIQVTVDGKKVRVGSRRYMEVEQLVLPEAGVQIAESAHAQGHSLVYIALDDQVAGAIELEPTVRPEAKRLVDFLHDRGIETYIISGDHDAPTRRLAEQLGIRHYFAETHPEQKAAHIIRLQETGRFVCFVGDGINDAIALKQAQISISLRGATTIATDTAQIIMMDQTLAQLPTLFIEAAAFEGNMQANLLTTVVPGVVIIGGALTGVVGFGASIALFSAGLGVGVINAMLPRRGVEHSRRAQTHAICSTS